MKRTGIRTLWLLGAAVVAAAAVLAAGCGGASGASTDTSTPASATVQVDLVMDWIPWVLDIPVDVAQAKGFYAQQGLSVHQTVPATATDGVKLVSTGKSQFALYYAPDMVMALDEGAPLVSVGCLMAHAPVGMAFQPGVTADSPAVLAGKVASVPLIPSTRASFDSMLAAAGVASDRVTVVDPGFDLVAPLLSGKVYAAAFTEFGELVEAKMQGQDLTYLDFRAWGTPDYPFLDVITTREFAASSPATVRAFLTATLEGLSYAAAHPDEAVALYVKAHPELEPKLLLAQWKAAVPDLALGTGGAGRQDAAAWQALAAWMQTSGLLKGAVDLAPAVTNDFLPPAK